MIIGLPGAGISTVFYLICVMLMPLHTLFAILAGRELRPGHWRLLARQLAIALGIMAMLVLTGLLLSIILAVGGAEGVSASDTIGQLWRTISRLGTVFALITLVVVIGSIKVLSVMLRRREASQRRGSLVRQPVLYED